MDRGRIGVVEVDRVEAASWKTRRRRGGAQVRWLFSVAEQATGQAADHSDAHQQHVM